jgi:hypothetical protein
MIGFALAATLLIPVGVAQAAPAPAKPVSQARQTAAVPVASPSSSYALYGKATVPLAAAGSTRRGCPYGDACMYTSSGWKSNTPEHEWYYYGCYGLSNEYGTRWIYDNQYGGGDIAGFGGYDCTGGVQWAAAPGGWGQVDITPTNYVEIYH